MKNTTNKPRVRLIGENGNIFNLLGIASKALKKAGQEEQAKKMREKIFSCGSYNEALTILEEYCEIE
jgi:hypothetical protein